MSSESMATNLSPAPKRTPVYFVSHGGPNIMFDTEHPARKHLERVGKEITEKVKPKAVIVFSAHWQAGKSHVEVNTAEITDLIYDYYNFPPEYYKVKYPHVGSTPLATRILHRLQAAGIDAKGVSRGLDHGVFAPFKCMFSDENPLNVPIVQVSLYGNEDPDAHFELGTALKDMRGEGVQIIGSGMAVHNLRDFFSRGHRSGALPYVTAFDDHLNHAVSEAGSGAERKTRLRELLWVKEARQAHPTFEHLLPVHIAAGAGGDDKAERTFTMPEGSMSWSNFRFGVVPTPANES